MSPLGLESGTVRVVEYDPQWPALYAAEVARIQPFAPTLGFEHVGSTAVPGLCAKPVLDILAGHPQTASPLEFVRALERAGYEHRGDAGIPDHQFFRRGQPRAYHIHLVARDSALWRQYVGFRDYLRTDARARQEYDALKRALAERFPHDRAAYIERKSSFVRRWILRR
ncbi:MAG TPA: GrpB family protein [Gemmatimonadales bacterium]|nr:GrpB family protein [Gemmatimonadales bacterium]